MTLSFNDLNFKLFKGDPKLFRENHFVSLSDDVSLTLFEHLGNNNGIRIENKNITIDGNGHCIDAKGKTRIFNIIGSNVTLKNIIFKNGKEAYGGAIRNNEGKIELINCKFINNVATRNGNDISNGPTGKIKIVNCLFLQNNNQLSIWNKGQIFLESEKEDILLKQLINPSDIKIIKREIQTKLSIVNVVTDKLTWEKHTIIVKLMDENENPLSGQTIHLENEFNTITNNEGEGVLLYQSDIPEDIELSINYEGDSYLNYLKAESIQCHLITHKREEPTPEYIIKEKKRYIKVKDEEIKSYQEIAPFEAFEPKPNEEKYEFIFISYAHIDAEEVYDDISELNNYENINIWYDAGIAAGTAWQEILQNKIEACSLFVVFISNNSIESNFVRNEITFALNLNKPCIPIHLSETELKHGLGLRMVTIQAILKYVYTHEEYIKKCKIAFENKEVDSADITSSNSTNKLDSIDNNKLYLNLNKILAELQYSNDLKELELGIIEKDEFNKRKIRHYSKNERFDKK